MTAQGSAVCCLLGLYSFTCIVSRETQVQQDPQGKVALLGFKGSEGAEGPLVQWYTKFQVSQISLTHCQCQILSEPNELNVKQRNSIFFFFLINVCLSRVLQV